MASKSESYNNINNYKYMKDKVNAIITYLNSYNDINNKLLVTINQNYEVDYDNPVIYDRIKDLSSDVNKTSNYLKYTILPAIDTAIQAENNNIASIEQKEAQEKARRDAEAMEQRAAEERARREEEERARREAQSTTSEDIEEKKTFPKGNRCPTCGSKMHATICPVCDRMIGLV